MKYNIIITDRAEEQMYRILFYIENRFGKEVAIKKLEQLQNQMQLLEDNFELGIIPKYSLLKRKGYRLLIIDKNIIFYKINTEKKEIQICAIVDYRQDIINIVRGM